MSSSAATEAGALADRAAALPRPLLLAFDVDGTLAPIVDDPAAARIPEGTRDLLEALGALPDVHVALVTGRDAASVDRVAGHSAVWRAVSHGRTVLAPDERAGGATWTAEQQSRLDAFRRWAEGHAVPEGARIEDKDGAVAVHTRVLAQRDPARAEAVLQQACDRATSGGLHVRMGRAVCEAEVESGDKGTAVAKLMAATGARGVVYAGDDLTDEPAIDRAVAAEGLGLFVGSAEREPPPQASAVVDGTEGVVALLRALRASLAP